MRPFTASLRLRLLASTIAALASQNAFAQTVALPTGGSVGAGAATIGGSGSAVSIHQTSNRAVINWNSFSIGAGGSVNVIQPGANAALLNRVTGNDVSQIAGSLTATGQVFLVNRNGILIDQSGKVDAHGGFVASTLDIKDDDFMAGRLAFAGSGAGSILNRGTIAGGAVALLGSSVSNIGTIVSPLGRVAIGAAQQATLDLNGDGFLQVAIPSALDGSGGPLIDQRGTIDVGGGLVVMRAATAREIVRQAINMSGIIRATSVSRDGGTVVLDGGEGGEVAVSGSITASGVRGGRVDISGGDVALSGASIAATGDERGGLVRIGGAFQGGVPDSAATAVLADKFVTRFGADSALRSARTTSIDATSNIDVSGGAAGGTAVVWSDQSTRQLGTFNASGAVGGAIELSSRGLLTTSLNKVSTGRGGSLLLDPKNIFVYNSYQMPAGATGDPLAGTSGYRDNPGGDSTFNVLDIKALIDGGTSVTLRASNDLIFNADLTVGFGAAPGDLVLSAGRSVSLAGYLTLNEADLSVTANDTLANGVVDADRDPGAASLDAFNAHISGSTASGSGGGNVSLRMGSGAGVTNGLAGDMRLASINARSITIDAGDRTVSLFDYDGGSNPATLSAAEALSLTGALRIQASDATLSGRTVNWTNEVSALLTASSPGTILRFIENGAPTRYGVLRGGEAGGEGAAATDTVRLALGRGGTAPAYTSIYGDAYGAFDALHLVSGTLQSGDTLDGILASGSTTTSGPAAGQGVGDYAVTTSATGGFGFASGVSGYFVNLASSSDVLRIIPKALTATVNAGAYTYGAPSAVAHVSGLIGNDQVGLTATVSGLGTQGLTGSGGAYSFAANLAAGQRSFTLTALSGAAAANYTLDLSGMIGASLAIDPKAITYAGTTASSIYGTLNTAGFVLAGMLAGDDVSLGVAGVTRSGVTTALTTTTGVGTYSTVAGTLGGASAGNYVVDSAHSSAGSAIIDPKALTYSTSNTSSTYGTLAAIAAPTLSGVIAGDAVGASALLNDGNVALSARTAAGNYNINAVLTGAGAGNYVLTGASQVGVLSVGRLMIGATVANTSQVYESTSALATLNGVLFGDDVVATGLLDGSAEGRVGVGETGVGFTLPDVGTHRFNLIGITGTGASNYILDPATTRSAILTVTPKPVNFSIGSLTTTYGDVIGGLALSLTTPTRYALSAPIVVTNSATGASALLSDAGRLGAGSYLLSAGALNPSAGSGNYVIASTGNQQGALVITPKGLTYSALSASGTYGNGLLNPGAVLNGAFFNDDVHANVSILASDGTAIILGDRTAAGSYRVTVNGISGSAAGNYTLTAGTDGTVTIAQRLVNYILGTASTTYGTPGNLSAQLNGVLAGDSVSPVYFTNGAPVTNRLNVGTYSVTLGGLGGADGGNYAIDASGNRNGELIIHPAPLTYSLAPATSVYGDALRFSPLIWSGLQFGEAAPSATVRLADSQFFTYVNAGTYRPDILTNVFGNYYLDTVHSDVGLYTITRRPIALESLSNSSFYGLLPNQLNGTVRVTNYLEGNLTVFTASAQNVTTSTGGYANAGSYLLKINAAVGDAFSSNYVIGSITQGNFTVMPRDLGISSIGLVNSVYGTTATLASRQITPLFGDLVSLSGLSLALGSQAVALGAQTPAGSYNILASGLSGADAANYTHNSAQEVGTLVIAPKPLIFNTGNLTATYGTLANLGTASLSGIVGNDQVVAVNSISGGYDDRSPVGTRQFNVPTLTGTSAANYSVNSAGSFGSYYGYLNIAPRPLSVTYLSAAAPTGWTFGTTSPSATRYFQLNGVLSGDSVSASPFAVLTGTAAGNPLSLGTYYNLADLLNAGTYRVSAFGSSGYGVLSGTSASNYILAPGSSINTPVSFTVSPRTIGGSLGVPAAITYGDAPALSVAFSNTVGGTAPAYAVNASLGTNNRNLGQATALPANLAVGTQNLSVALTGLDSFNYFLSAPVLSQVSITPKTVSIDQLLYSVTYGLASGAAFAINGMIAGDDVAPLVSLGGDFAVRAATLSGGFGLPLVTRDVGTYTTTIGALTGASAGNYLLTAFSGTMGITPKTITYTSDGFAAQYGGLTLPTCASGCELSGKDNGLAMGAVALNGALAQDLGSLTPMVYLSFDGRSSAFAYARNTAAGNYLQIVNGLAGSKAGNYVLDTQNSKAGLVVILPAWVKAIVTGGGRLYTNKASGTYVSLGTPGVVTIQRSDNLTAAQGANSFYPGDGVNVVTKLVDAKGNIVDGGTTLPVGSYTINPLLLVGPQAANYRLVPEGGANGSVAGIFTVADSSVFNFSFLGSSPTGYYVPPAISNPPIAPTTVSSSSIGSTTTTAAAGLLSGAATVGATGSTSITQTSADGSSLTGSASGTVGASAGYTATGATATAELSGNVSLLINRGPVTINYGAFADASGKVEISLKDLTIAAGGEVMAGVQEGIAVGGSLGSGMTGSTGLQAQGFATANGETSMSLKNGANLGTSGFIGVGASIGVDGSLSGGGVTGSLAATLYSPGSLYIGAKVESGYEDHTLTLGLNLGISLLIGGVEVSPKISFSTTAIEAAGTDFANAWLGLGEKMLGVYCDSACTAAQAKIQADYDAQVKADALDSKVSAATQLMYNYTKPSLPMIQYLQANPDVVHFAQEAQANGTTTPATNAITSAVSNYQYLTDYLASVVSQEKALATRIAANPTSITAADLAQANYLRTQEKAVVDSAAAMFNMRVVVSNGQLTFG